jgi:hypothetical protein
VPPPSFFLLTVPLVFRSGLTLGLVDRLLNDSFNLLTGDVGLLVSSCCGASKDSVVVDADCAGIEELPVGETDLFEAVGLSRRRFPDFMRGEDVVKYPICEGCEASGGGTAEGLSGSSCQHVWMNRHQ